MAKANETRGEVSLILEGVEYGLRASHAAIDEFEATTGKTSLQLYSMASSTGLILKDAAAIVGPCIRAWGESVTNQVAAHVNDQRIKELLVESEGGILVVTKKLAILLLLCVTGGITSSGEVKALPSSAMTPAPKKTRAAG